MPDATWDRRFTWPNVVSLVRLAIGLPVLFIVLVLWHHKLAAVAVYTGFALSDNIDGYLARRFNWRSKFGQMLDPTIDTLYVVFACGLIAYSLSRWLLAPLGLIMCREIMLGWFFIWVRRKGYEIDGPTKWGKKSRFLTNGAVAFSVFVFATDGELQLIAAIVLAILLPCAMVLSYWTAIEYVKDYFRMKERLE